MKIALVEDDINMRKTLEIAFAERSQFELLSFKSAKDALKKLDDTFDLVITDLTMPAMDGLEFLRELGGKYEAIVITGNATLNKAIEAMRLGAKDFLQKPFEIEMLIEAINRAGAIKLKKSAIKAVKSVEPPASDQFFIATSPALERQLQVARKVAATDACVMLLGESGVGKEVFAGFIHSISARNDKPFVAINMAALPETLVESELFGYDKGAFSDASATGKIGRFEEANGGTLFLDEIAEMPFDLQSKLLRAVQEKKIRRLGGVKDINIDVRIISATNQDIDASIKDKKFREDLYYRLNTIEIMIPPLRERKEEILLLAEGVLSSVCAKCFLGSKQFSDEAKQELLAYEWHGNVRELISVCERSAILSEGELITPNDLFLRARIGGTKSAAKSVADMEKELISEALSSANGDTAEAAKLLAMSVQDFASKKAKYQL
ncbi:ATPase AAA [Campylobacterota bacterium]|nr:ATPase AAA [Campylobacterota bacterium]